MTTLSQNEKYITLAQQYVSRSQKFKNENIGKTHDMELLLTVLIIANAMGIDIESFMIYQSGRKGGEKVASSLSAFCTQIKRNLRFIRKLKTTDLGSASKGHYFISDHLQNDFVTLAKLMFNIYS